MSGPDDSPRGAAGSGEVSWGPRILGPLALVAVLIALIVVINGSSGEDGDAGTPTTTSQKSDRKSGDGAVNPRTYVVESGDTLSSIATRFDVSTKRLLRLNPGIVPQALATGTELKIR